MQINVDINPEEVNRQVSAAIINSALGKELKKEIESALNETIKGGFYGSSVIKRVVDEQVRIVVRDLVAATEYHEKIKVIVEKYLAERLTDEIITAALDKVWSKLID